MRKLLKDIKAYLEKKENKENEENILLERIIVELRYVPVTTISIDDIENLGYNVENVTDDDVESVANKMADYYEEYGDFKGDLEASIEKCLGLEKEFEDEE